MHVYTISTTVTIYVPDAATAPTVDRILSPLEKCLRWRKKFRVISRKTADAVLYVCARVCACVNFECVMRMMGFYYHTR